MRKDAKRVLIQRSDVLDKLEATLYAYHLQTGGKADVPTTLKETVAEVRAPRSLYLLSLCSYLPLSDSIFLSRGPCVICRMSCLCVYP